MRKTNPLIGVLLALFLAPGASAQECLSAPGILWSSPEKNAQDVPSNSALILSVPSGQTLSVLVNNAPLSAKGTQGPDPFVFPLASLPLGPFNGAIETGTGGSTNKKLPFKFDIVGATAISPPASPTVLDLLSDGTAETALTPDCATLAENLFCTTAPHQGQITLVMGSAAHAWAVKNTDSAQWAILPGTCAPTLRTGNIPSVGTCMDVIALNQAGEHSETVSVCVGDYFGPAESLLTVGNEDDTSDSGCRQSADFPVLPGVVLLMYAGWAWLRLRKNLNA